MSCEQRLRSSDIEGTGSAQHDASFPEVSAQVLGDGHNLRLDTGLRGAHLQYAGSNRDVAANHRSLAGRRLCHV